MWFNVEARLWRAAAHMQYVLTSPSDLHHMEADLDELELLETLFVSCGIKTDRSEAGCVDVWQIETKPQPFPSKV